MKTKSEIKWLSIEGRNITGIYYDEETSILYIRFKANNAYAYENVSVKEYKEFLATESIMKHFHSKIKSKKTTKL